MGGGKSSGSGGGTTQTTVQLSPEQRRILGLQADALEKTFLPAYEKTIGTAKDVYDITAPAAYKASDLASGVASRTGAVNEATGTLGTLTGTAGLMSLFDPQYEQQQVDAALQAGRESARESQAGQNAMYGAAGGLGSSRMALADKNLSSLNAQRQATAAAQARAGVQANKAAAAAQLIGSGQNATSLANQAAAAGIGYAQTPQDVLGKYASIIYGAPQGAYTPNFTGTQGTTATNQQNTASQGKGFKL